MKLLLDKNVQGVVANLTKVPRLLMEIHTSTKENLIKYKGFYAPEIGQPGLKQATKRLQRKLNPFRD